MLPTASAQGDLGSWCDTRSHEKPPFRGWPQGGEVSLTHCMLKTSRTSRSANWYEVQVGVHDQQLALAINSNSTPTRLQLNSNSTPTQLQLNSDSNSTLRQSKITSSIYNYSVSLASKTLLLILTLSLLRMIPDRNAYEASILIKIIRATLRILKSVTEERSDKSILLTNSSAASDQHSVGPYSYSADLDSILS
eukprot:sb/3470989/